MQQQCLLKLIPKKCYYLIIIMAFLAAVSVSRTGYAEDVLSEEKIIVKNPFEQDHKQVSETIIEPKANSDIVIFVKTFLAETIGQSPEKRLELASVAIEQANAKLSKQPLKIEHHLLKVAALGATARATPFMESLKARYGSKSKQAVHDMLTVAPKDPWALFFAGIWHLEVERRGGLMGSLLLGGSVEEGHHLIAEAMKKLPDESAFSFAYAITLLSLNFKNNIDQSKLLLIKSKSSKNTNGDVKLQNVINQQATSILLLISESQYKQAKEHVLSVM